MSDCSPGPEATDYPDKILIIDYGGQYTQLIARCVRELGVYCAIMPGHAAAARIAEFAAHGIILSGSYATVTTSTQSEAYAAAQAEIFSSTVPVLGICYGLQHMVAYLGGGVATVATREYGPAVVTTTAASSFSGECGQRLEVWMSHGDQVVELPPGFIQLGATPSCRYAMIADPARQLYGVQFHPEVTHTPCGRTLLARFLYDICGCEQSWEASRLVTRRVAWIRQQVGDDQVLLGLSGGVDSAVVAALVQRAIGDNLHCIFVDTGLLRAQESEQVMATFAEDLGVRVQRVEAATTFLTALADVADPEQKRKIIGHHFVEIFTRAAKAAGDAKWLAQGTIYPDVIESAGNPSAPAIKSHHNVGGLPDNLQLKLLEPVRDLFKDEVRKIGYELGLPARLIERHPFPGPGLAVRILGPVTAPAVEILRQADAIFIEELHAADWYRRTSQAFAVFLPIKSVGVVGDNRTYEYVIALRAVETTDFMTANWAALPVELLATVSNRIINEVRGVSRVTYDISNKPPATIEWE